MAVDILCRIIRTNDRNLALLLGRSLDAQKFFHDVTYNHRLRDSVHEVYAFNHVYNDVDFSMTMVMEHRLMVITVHLIPNMDHLLTVHCCKML